MKKPTEDTLDSGTKVCTQCGVYFRRIKRKTNDDLEKVLLKVTKCPSCMVKHKED